MFFEMKELGERIAHIESYLDGKTNYMWPEATGNPWQERWIKEYLGILRESYYEQRTLHLDPQQTSRLLK